MCDFGITALVTSVVATVLSTTMGVVSSVQQGKAAQAQMNYQAEINRRNAKIAQQIPKGKKIVLGLAHAWEERKGLSVFKRLAKDLPSNYACTLHKRMIFFSWQC